MDFQWVTTCFRARGDVVTGEDDGINQNPNPNPRVVAAEDAVKTLLKAIQFSKANRKSLKGGEEEVSLDMDKEAAAKVQTGDVNVHFPLQVKYTMTSLTFLVEREFIQLDVTMGIGGGLDPIIEDVAS